MEKINLFELDIDIERLTDNAGKVYQEIDKLQDAQKSLKKTSSDLKTQMQEQNKVMLEAKKAGDSKTYKESEVVLGELKKQYEDTTRAMTKNKAELGAVRKEYNMASKLVDVYAEKEMKNLTIINQTDGSIDQISAALSKNKAVYKSLSKEQRENTEIGEKLLKLIQSQDEEYKTLNKEIGNTSVEVGNYKEEMKKALAETGLFSQIHANLLPIINAFKVTYSAITSQFKEGVKAIRSYSQAQTVTANATKVTTAATRLFAGALLATGIPIIVAALIALVSWFKKTQAGADKLGQIMAGITAVIDVFVDRISKIGGIVAKLFTGQSSLSEAWRDGKGALSGMGDEMKRELDLAVKLEKSTQNLEKAEQLLSFQRAANNTKIKELNKTIDDTTKSTGERLKAAQEVERLESEMAQKELDNANKRLALALGKEEVDQDTLKTLSQLKEGTIEYNDLLSKLGLSESNKEDVEELLAAFEAAEQAQQASFEIRTINQNKTNTLIKEEAAKREEAKKIAIDAALQESETRLKIFIAENQDKARTLQEQLDFEADVYKKQTELLEQQLKAGKISQSEYDLSMIEAKRDFLKVKSDLTVSYAEKELDLYIAKNKSKIDSETRLTESIVSEEERRLQSIYVKELEFLNKQLEDKIIAEQDYQLRKIDLQNQYIEQENNLKKEYRAQQLEQEQVDFETDIELRAIRGESEYQIQIAQLDREYLAKRQKAIEDGTWSVKQEELYAAKRKQITEEETKNRLSLYSNALGNVASLLGEQTAAGKAAAVAQATIDTYMAANAAYSSLAGIPIVGPALGAIAAGVAVVAGIKNVKKIVSTKTEVPKAERGAVFDIGGKRHSSGGTKFYGEDGTTFEAERGEKMFILNRMASKAYAPYLSKINQMYGGVPLSRSSNYLAAGGAVARVTGSTPTVNVQGNNVDFKIDYDLLAQKIAQANLSLPNPVTDVKDIISEVTKYNKVIDGASF